MKRVVEWTLMPDSNLSGVSIPRQRGMVNPHSDGGVGCNDNVAGNAMECDDVKLPAIAYVDDRAIRFDGDYGQVLEQLHTFQPYWKGGHNA